MDLFSQDSEWLSDANKALRLALVATTAPISPFHPYFTYSQPHPDTPCSAPTRASSATRTYASTRTLLLARLMCISTCSTRQPLQMHPPCSTQSHSVWLRIAVPQCSHSSNTLPQRLYGRGCETGAAVHANGAEN